MYGFQKKVYLYNINLGVSSCHTILILIFLTPFLFQIMKGKEIALSLLGVILTPLFFSVFVLDRCILVVLFWVESLRFSKWIDSTEQISYSFIRVLAITCLLLLINLAV